MSTEIGFVDSLGESNETQASFNYPKKLYYDGAKRTNDAAGVNKENQICTYNTLYDLNTERLLRRASLLVTPTFYKEGTLFSVKPTGSTNGNFTVTRATTATRVNAAGLVELVPYNLLTWSEMFTQTTWVKSNTTITANTTTAPNDTLTADKIVSNASNGFIYQQFSAVANTTYTFSCYVKTSNISTTLDIALLNAFGASGIANVSFTTTNNWTRVSVTGLSLTTQNAWVALGTGGTFSTGEELFIWGAQLVEGTSALDYQMTETRLNIPRLDYSLGSCPNILLEPQRTNLALRSEEFENVIVWTSSIGGTGVLPTRTANSVISPSGVQNADTIVFNRGAGNTINDQCVISQPITIPTTGTYYFSVWMKATTSGDVGKQVLLRCGNSGTLTPFTLTANWTRFETTASVTLGLSSFQIGNRGTITTGNSVSVDLWGAQLEAGAYATSYIPTVAASVTRNADVISRGNIFTNGLITASGGTWFVDLRNNLSRVRDNGSNGLFLSSTSTGSGGDTLGFQSTGGAVRMSVFRRISGTFASLFTLTTDNAKVAIKWNGTTADVFVNGVKVVTATSFTATNLDFLSGLAADVPKNINSMALFPTPLTDGEMSMLTSGVYTPALAYAQLGLTSESPACLDSSVNALL
jgi:hypothetical protein